MQVNNDQLSEFLFDAGLVSRGDLARAVALAEEEGRSLIDVLTQGGIVGDDDVRQTLARMLGIPFIMFEGQVLKEEAMLLLPEPMSRTHNAVVVDAKGTRLEIAFLDMQDVEPIQAFFGESWTILPRLTTRASVKTGLLQYQRVLRDMYGARITEELRSLEQAYHAKDHRGMSDAAVRVTDALVQHALHAQAQELHIEPIGKAGSQGVRIRYRLGAALYDAMHIPAYASPFLSARLKSLAHIPLTHVSSTGRFKMGREGMRGEEVSVALITIPLVLDTDPVEKLVLSFMYNHIGRSGLSLLSLGVTPHHIETIQKFMYAKSGLVLVCGVEGAGKTTMLYTLLDECTHPSKNVASVEEEVKYALPAVSQMEVDASLGLTPVSCVRTQLRQNPDVLMIDCSLSEELVLLAAHAANQGTLVFLGVEAVTAAEGFAQLLARGVPPDLLATVCVGSIAVHTMPRLCNYKSARYKPARNEQTLLEDVVSIKETIAKLKTEQVIDQRIIWKDIELYQPTPCPHCENGFAGLTGLQEVVPMSRMLKECIRQNADLYSLETQAKQDGNLTLAEDALYKGIQGIVSADSVLEVAAGYQARYR